MRRSRQGSLLRAYFFSPGHAQLASRTDFLFHTTPLGSLVAGWRTRANSDTLHANDDQRSLMCMQQLHLQCNPIFRPLVYLSVLVLHHFLKLFSVLCLVSPFCSLFSVFCLIFRTLFPVFSFSFCFDFGSLFRFHFLFPVFFVVLIQVTSIGILFRSRRTWMSKGVPSTEWRHAKLPDIVRRLQGCRRRSEETLNFNLKLRRIVK